MEKDPKKPTGGAASARPLTSPLPAATCAGPARFQTGVLREVACEIKEQARPNAGLLRIDYYTLFWIFVAGCVFGLVVETLFHAIAYGGYESRAGLVWGPFSPIYGIGAVLLTSALNRFSHSHNLIVFVVSMVLGSLVEYSASWAIELLWGAAAWDYSNTFGSIGGRTNLAFGVMWGLLGLLWVRVALPFIKQAFSCVNAKSLAVKALTVLLSLFMLADVAVTVLALDRESQRAAGLPATTQEQRFFDENFPDTVLQSRMQNMSVYGKD